MFAFLSLNTLSIIWVTINDEITYMIAIIHLNRLFCFNYVTLLFCLIFYALKLLHHLLIPIRMSWWGRQVNILMLRSLYLQLRRILLDITISLRTSTLCLIFLGCLQRIQLLRWRTLLFTFNFLYFNVRINRLFAYFQFLFAYFQFLL